MPYNLRYDFPQYAKLEIWSIFTKPSQEAPFMTLSITVLIFDKPLQHNTQKSLQSFSYYGETS